MRQILARVLRDTGLLSGVDTLRYWATRARLRKANRNFVRANPDFALPPPALAYDAYSAPDWPFYRRSGAETAVFLASFRARYLGNAPAIKVLEWGCGPARVIRHLPATFGPKARIYGSDYNPDTIAWCQRCIPGITFVHNGLRPEPRLPFEDGCLDFIYSISVFTHLSESISFQWAGELFRVASAGGILVITTNGDSHQSKMLPDELTLYHERGVMIRDKTMEGKKLFSSAHSPRYAREKLFKDFKVLEHVPAAFPFTLQDCWVLRRS